MDVDIKTIKEQIMKSLDEMDVSIESMILFGSRARGDAHKDSDYDVLLLVKKRTKELEDQINDIAYEMLDRYGKLVMIFDSEAEIYEDEEDDPLFTNIHREGVTL